MKGVYFSFVPLSPMKRKNITSKRTVFELLSWVQLSDRKELVSGSFQILVFKKKLIPEIMKKPWNFLLG